MNNNLAEKLYVFAIIHLDDIKIYTNEADYADII